MGLFDSLTGGIGGVGLVGSLIGGIGSYETAQETANVQKEAAQKSFGIESQISGLETQVNDQRRSQMELSARRQTLEDFRVSQMSRAKGLANATNQNAQFSSSAQAGQGNATSQGLFNVQGVNNNLEIGRNIFGLDSQISQQKLALSGVQTQANMKLSDLSVQGALFSGISNLGGSVTKNAGTLATIFG